MKEQKLLFVHLKKSVHSECEYIGIKINEIFASTSRSCESVKFSNV